MKHDMTVGCGIPRHTRNYFVGKDDDMTGYDRDPPEHDHRNQTHFDPCSSSSYIREQPEYAVVSTDQKKMKDKKSDHVRRPTTN